ncbi:hypothetical protein YC2023_023040 [Brassica napus]
MESSSISQCITLEEAIIQLKAESISYLLRLLKDEIISPTGVDWAQRQWTVFFLLEAVRGETWKKISLRWLSYTMPETSWRFKGCSPKMVRDYIFIGKYIINNEMCSSKVSFEYHYK